MGHGVARVRMHLLRSWYVCDRIEANLNTCQSLFEYLIATSTDVICTRLTGAHHHLLWKSLQEVNPSLTKSLSGSRQTEVQGRTFALATRLALPYSSSTDNETVAQG